MLFQSLQNQTSANGRTLGFVWSPCHQSLRRVCLHWPWLWGRGTKGVERLLWGPARNILLEVLRGAPKCQNFHGKPFSRLFESGGILVMLSASFRIVYCFACKGLEASTGQTLLVFPLPTKGQRHSSLIQKCHSKIDASFQAFWELAGQSSKVGQRRRADERDTMGDSGDRTALRLLTAFFLHHVTSVLLHNSDIPASPRSFSDLISFMRSTTQVHSELFVSRLLWFLELVPHGLAFGQLVAWFHSFI